MTRKRVAGAKRKVKKEPKLFKYAQRYSRPDPYYAMLNNIQHQANIVQVNSLIRELRQSQEFARRARQDAIDEIYEPVRPMDVDEHAPSTLADIHTNPMHRRATRAAQTTSRGSQAGGDLQQILNRHREDQAPQPHTSQASSQTERPRMVNRKTQVQSKTRSQGVSPYTGNNLDLATHGWDPSLFSDTFLFKDTSSNQTAAERKQARKLLHPRPFNPTIPSPSGGNSTPPMTNFIHGNRLDTWLDYQPRTRDNKSPRLEATSRTPTGAPLGRESRFFPTPPRGLMQMADID